MEPPWGIRKKDMGQPTGFLEYARVGLKERTPEERLKDFEDFHVPLSDAERRKQVTAAWTAAVDQLNKRGHRPIHGQSIRES